MSYEYQTNGADGQKARVTAIRETGADGTSGNRVDIAYGVNNTTHFAYTCGDKTSGETYQFDNCGRTKAIRNDDGSFAQAAYHPDAGRTGNRITQSSSGEQYVNNLLQKKAPASGRLRTVRRRLPSTRRSISWATNR